MAKRVAKKDTPARDEMVQSIMDYLEYKEMATKFKAMQDDAAAKIKEHIHVVNQELTITDNIDPTNMFMFKLAITTRDTLDTKAVKAMLTPTQLQSVTKTSPIETLTVKRLATQV